MYAPRALARTRPVAAFLAVLLAAGTLALSLPGQALADSAPMTAATPTTVSADGLPTVQINGVVWSQVVVGNTVYAAGSFTSARPAGSPAGTNETPRNNLLAYDITTGALDTSFAPNLNGQALVVAASPDGSRIYVGGDFTQVDGQARKRVAAFDTASGALLTTWHPAVAGQVRALAATNSTVYLGGEFTAVGSVTRTHLAAVSAADGSLLPWAPVPGPGSTKGNVDPNKTAAQNAQLDYGVMGLTITGGGSQVVAGGRFDTINGVKATGVAAIDPTTGANLPFAVNQKLTNQGINSAVYSVTTTPDGKTVIGTAYDFYGPGNLEGYFEVTADGGNIIDINDCRGDTYSSVPIGDAVYVSSHEHDCSNIGGFPEQNPRVNKFGTAFSFAPGGTVGKNTEENANFVGQPAPTQLDWFPTLTPGTYTGASQAGWSVTGNSQYVVYGGEFPKVNGVDQQGLVRFAVPSIAPNKVGPTASDGLTPTATSAAAGTATLTWTATSDKDNENLTYRVYRDGDLTTPVYTAMQASRWYQTPAMSFIDTAVPGGTHTYRVTVTDPFGNSTSSADTSVDVVAAPTGSAQTYAAQVVADGAQHQWRLGDTAGATTADSVGASPMTVGTGVSRGVTGALTGDSDTAFSFDGASSATLSTTTAAAAPDTVSEEAWFKTTSKTGGRIMGFGNAKTGSSSAYDRQVYLDAAGHVTFGVKAPFFWIFTQTRTVASPNAYNDGAWHQVVATLSPAGMALFVDGNQVAARSDTTRGQSYNGYFRVGADAAMGGSATFTGSLDEVALYPSALAPSQVAAQYLLGTTGRPANVPPTARFGQTANYLAVAFDASASIDPDGSISSYGWDFGDGSTGSGVAPSHTYAAAGTYSVKLTVTDDKGATGSVSVPVTVVANRPPVATFSMSVTDRQVAVDASQSEDPDGSPLTYAWDFGDGSTATGATASHTYGADGTYTITLTVTDAPGASATSTDTVTVSAPVILASDSFNRTVASGLGTADVGGAWTTTGTPRQSVAPGVASMRLDAPGNNDVAYLGSVSQTSADVLTSVSLTAAPTGNGTSVYITGRRVGTNLEYRGRLRFLANGTVGVAVSQLNGTASEKLIGGEVIVPGLTYTPGATLQFRLQVSGVGTTTLAATVWAAGTTEPGTPTVSRTDTTPALQAAGGVGLSAYLAGNATVPLVVQFTGLRVTPVA